MFMCLPQKGENQSYFDLSVRVAADMLKARILSAENDEIALVFFGTVRVNWLVAT